LGEKSTGPNPTDRAKSGTKRSILVDGKGVPIGVSVDGANRHDMKMSKATIQSIGLKLDQRLSYIFFIIGYVWGPKSCQIWFTNHWPQTKVGALLGSPTSN
jgi:hypothetical protein